MIIIGVVDVEIFLTLVREDRVQFEEVLPSGSRAESGQCLIHKPHHLLLFMVIYTVFIFNFHKALMEKNISSIE